MRVSVVLEQRFQKTPEGMICDSSGIFKYSFWTRYLEVFDSVNIIARLGEATAGDCSSKRVDGEKVIFSAVPSYIGPKEFLMNACRIRRALRRGIDRNDAVILRVPGTLGTCLGKYLRRIGHPYALEVVGDPYDVFSSGAVEHPLRPFFRYYFSKNLREQCKHAAACSYVTQHAIQSRYPPGKNAFSTFYSDIELPPEAFVACPRILRGEKTSFTIVFVGSLEQMYKAPDVLIDAADRCVQAGIDLRLNLIGDGKERAALESRPAARRLGDRLRFIGQLPAGEAIRKELDSADLFVLPSRTEGLPRAMIEAMARGLPCIGSTVGGFPELLPAEDLVPPGDAAALTNKIREILENPARMSVMSRRNLEKAAEYRNDVLQARRREFYQYVKEHS